MISVLGQQLLKSKLVSGVLTIVLGAMVLAWPGTSSSSSQTRFGVYLLVSGLAELFVAFTLPRNAATRVLLFLTGALSVCVGDFVLPPLRRRLRRFTAVAMDRNRFHLLGVSENAVALGERDLPGRGWYVVLGVMSLIAGAVVLVWPFDSIVVLTLVSGASLMILGVIQIVQAVQIHSDTKAARKTFGRTT